MTQMRSSTLSVLLLQYIAIAVMMLFILPPLPTAVAAPSSNTSFVWDTQTVVEGKTLSDFSSNALKLDAMGHPHIAYGGSHLRYARYDGANWEREILGFDARGVSLALDQQGYPHISYCGNDHLHYVHWTGMGWISEIADNTCYRSSLALSPEGHPHIAYLDTTQKSLRYAIKVGSVWQTATVDVGAAVDIYTMEIDTVSIAVDGQGDPHISYVTFGQLAYAHWNGSEWMIERRIVDIWVGRDATLAVDQGGTPHISYSFDEQLWYATRHDAGWIHSVVAAGASSATMALDQNDQPYIAYTRPHDADDSWTLDLAHWDGTVWQTEIVVQLPYYLGGLPGLALHVDTTHLAYIASDNSLVHVVQVEEGWRLTQVDTTILTGKYPSLALDGNGDVHLVYQTTLPHGEVHYAHSSDNGWLTETVEHIAACGFGCAKGSTTDVALDSSHKPHLVYNTVEDWYLKDVRYAFRDNATWITQTVPIDAASAVIAVDPHDIVHIATINKDSSNKIDYAVQASDGWNVHTIEAGWSFPDAVALAVDSNGHPHIAYGGAMQVTPWIWEGNLSHSRWTGSEWETTVIYGMPNAHVSMALDKDDTPHVSYVGDGLMYAYWNGDDWTVETVEAGGSFSVGAVKGTALALTSDGAPSIAYHDWTDKAVKYAVREGERWSISVVAQNASAIEQISLAIDDANRPHIAFDNSVRLVYALGRKVHGTLHLPMLASD